MSASFFRRAAWKAHPPSLALGGGGARGFAHIGILQALDHAHLPVRAIAGTSMGAVVGAMYAATRSGDIVFAKWREALDRDLIPDAPPSSRARGDRSKEHPLLQAARRFRDRLVVSFALQQQTMMEDDGIDEAIDFLLPDVLIEDLRIPFAAVATDLGTGENVVLRSGPLRAAVKASGAIPGVLAAVEVDGRTLVDGAVTSEVPVAAARRLARPVVAVDVSMDLPELRDDDIALDTMMRTQMMTSDSLRTRQLEAARWVLRPAVGHATWSDWGRFEELVAAGADAMRRWLD